MSQRLYRRIRPSDSSDPESISGASDGEGEKQSSPKLNPNWKLLQSTTGKHRRVREVGSEEDEPYSQKRQPEPYRMPHSEPEQYRMPHSKPEQYRMPQRQASPPLSRMSHMSSYLDWAIIKTETTLAQDLSTLNRYNDLPYLEPRQTKNAVFLLAKIYTPSTENIRYTFKENQKDNLTTEEVYKPPIGTLNIYPHSRTLEIFVNLIVQYNGREAMNKLKQIVTAAILGNAEINDSFNSLYERMGGDPGQHATSDIKKRNVRLTCDRNPGEHAKYGNRIPQTWHDMVGSKCPSCSGRIIIQKLDEGLHYWYKVDN